MSITLYDKQRKMKRGLGNVVRIELRLLHKKLRTELGNGQPVSSLYLHSCYEVLRKKLLRFSTPVMPRISPKSKLQIYKLAVEEKWKVKGRPAIDVLLAEHDPKVRARVMRQVARTQLKSYQINWRRLLPKQMPQVFVKTSKEIWFSSPQDDD